MTWFQLSSLLIIMAKYGLLRLATNELVGACTPVVTDGMINFVAVWIPSVVF
jgi:hypothetical protein